MPGLQQLLLLVLVASVLLVASASAQKTQGQFSKVIYGRDDRMDTYLLSDSDQELGRGVAVLLQGNNILTENNDGTFTASAVATAEDFWDFCPSETFSQQLILANGNTFCTGFLVSTNPPWLATAAHCVNDDELGRYVVIFDFELISEDDTRLNFAATSVYTVDRVVARGVASGGVGDYGVIELDRPVIGRDAYTEISTDVTSGDDLTLVGHPVGLPKKTDKGGKVQSVSTNFFRATVDTYGGNSGSPVFDSTGRLVGILVGGAPDFVKEGDDDDSCERSNVCPGGIGCDLGGEVLIPICAIVNRSEVAQQLNYECQDLVSQSVASISSSGAEEENGAAGVAVPLFLVLGLVMLF